MFCAREEEVLDLFLLSMKDAQRGAKIPVLSFWVTLSLLLFRSLSRQWLPVASF